MAGRDGGRPTGRPSSPVWHRVSCPAMRPALRLLPLSTLALAGGVALAILMIPTVTRTTEEMLKLVPGSYREAGLALGIPQWKTTLRIVLPAALKGINPEGYPESSPDDPAVVAELERMLGKDAVAVPATKARA